MWIVGPTLRESTLVPYLELTPPLLGHTWGTCGLELPCLIGFRPASRVFLGLFLMDDVCRVDGVYIFDLNGDQEVALYGNADRLNFHAGGHRQGWQEMGHGPREDASFFHVSCRNQ